MKSKLSEQQITQRRPGTRQRASSAGKNGVAAAAPASGSGPANRTGLPDTLKSGIESLSGMALDDVRVHYNSPQPKRLQALAYAQGSDIHLAPGQERHLPHEAWHVVQQAQGRVKPTGQVAGAALNDDRSLESEADEMGRRALAGGAGMPQTMPQHGQAAIQRMPQGGSASLPVQRTPESDMTANPATFMATNLISLNMADGVKAMVPGIKLTDADAFVNLIATLKKHWFILVPDRGRSKTGRKAYILTPAIEKYAQAYPENELLVHLKNEYELPQVGGDEAYIPAGYVKYRRGGVGVPEDTIGHADIVRSRETEADWNPDFVFTDAMNGCAFTTTPLDEDTKFRTWHFQSPGSNLGSAKDFRREKFPTDWFGPDEYDHDEHPGLFEVTNLLHRDRDDQWNLISQQNEVDNFDNNDATIKQVERRPLALDAPNEAKSAKMMLSVYLEALKAQKKQFTRNFVNVLSKPDVLNTLEQKILVHVTERIKSTLANELQQLEGLRTRQALHDTAQTLLAERAMLGTEITPACQRVLAQIEIDYTAAGVSTLFSRKSKREEKQKDLNLLKTNLEKIIELLPDVDWIRLLLAETAPPAV